MFNRAKLNTTKRDKRRKGMRMIMLDVASIMLFLIINALAVLVVGFVLCNLDSKTPAQFSLPVMQLTHITRSNSLMINEHYINTKTGERFVKTGKQWRSATTGRFVSAKHIGV